MANGASQAGTVPSDRFGWLRNVPFDLTLIVGVAALALMSGGIVVLRPDLFHLILFLDVWIFGFHHVVATFTRLTFDTESFRQYRHLVTWLPVLIVAATYGATKMFGFWILPTTYLYWQWFHYTRQSYGIARVYQLKSDPASKPDQWLLYSVPAAGILYRSFQDPDKFLNGEVKCLPVPWWIVEAALVISAALLIVWVFRLARSVRNGNFPFAYALYILSHVAIFTTGYLLIDNIDYGWLVINVWHNAQYIMFVWMYNNKRFHNKVDPEHRFLSTLSQTRNQWLYYGVCLGISTAVYLSVKSVLGSGLTVNIPLAALVVYQTINFHHYVVDGIIWKVRKKTVRRNFGISG